MNSDEALRRRCRCRNLDDPNKIFQLVISALRHINGKGASIKDVRCYIAKYHRVPMSDKQLTACVQAAVCKAEGLGFLRWSKSSGKYFIAATSSTTCPKDAEPEEMECETEEDTDEGCTNGEEKEASNGHFAQTPRCNEKFKDGKVRKHRNCKFGTQKPKGK